jgi:hypothetical protein
MERKAPSYSLSGCEKCGTRDGTVESIEVGKWTNLIFGGRRFVTWRKFYCASCRAALAAPWN